MALPGVAQRNQAAAAGAVQAGRPAQVESSSCCTNAKLQRLAHRFFAGILYSCAFLLAGAAIVGAISAWFILGALFVASGAHHHLMQANRIVDTQDANEMNNLRQSAVNMTFSELTRKLTIRDILNFNIVSRENLSRKVAADILVHPTGLGTSMRADYYLEQRLISFELHRAIKDRVEPEIRRLARAEMGAV